MLARNEKMEKLISVIVPAYNVEQYLEKCINSILNQTYRELEVILVDDGSTDGTGRLCDVLAKRDERLIVIHKENGGLSDARNAGLEVATGDFISFIDADDYIELDMYECMIEEMKDETISMAAVGFIVTDASGNDRVLAAQKKRKLTKEEALMDIFENGEMFPSSVNKLYRRVIFKELRYVKGIINEDTEIIPKVIDLCNYILVLDKAAYHYVLRKDSITQSDFTVKDYESISVYNSGVQVCSKKYPELLPYACYYELKEIYETRVRLINSRNASRLRKQSFLLRLKVASGVAKCIKWKCIREKYSREILIYILSVLFGYRFVYQIMMLKQSISPMG